MFIIRRRFSRADHSGCSGCSDGQRPARRWVVLALPLLLSACAWMGGEKSAVPPRVTAPVEAPLPSATPAPVPPPVVPPVSPDNATSPASPATSPAISPATPIAQPESPKRPLRIGLALGGGAARGFAHIGVIKALEARGIVPDFVAGTSAGSLVGALYCGGFSGIELNRLALTMDESALSDWSLQSRGLFKGQGLQDYVNKTLEHRPIERLPRRFAATATDLRTGQLTVFERGNTGQAVRASSSVPGVFEPVSIGEREYVDGGLVTPVPVRVVRRMGADVVIAVDISARPENGDPSGMLALLLQTFAIMGQTIGGYELGEADIVIRPQLNNVRGTDFTARHSAILAGEQAVVQVAARLQETIARKKRELNAQ